MDWVGTRILHWGRENTTPPLSFFFHCWNFCTERPSLGSVRNSVCLWPVIDNAAQAALVWSVKREPAWEAKRLKCTEVKLSACTLCLEYGNEGGRARGESQGEQMEQNPFTLTTETELHSFVYIFIWVNCPTIRKLLPQSCTLSYNFYIRHVTSDHTCRTHVVGETLGKDQIQREVK